MAKKLNKTDRMLVIVESPTKAKKITKILDDAGYKVMVMASKGHIMTLADKRTSYKNSGVFPENDFDLNLQIDEDHYQIVQNLKEQADRASKVVIFSDADREGELIGWSLVKFLKLKPELYYRAYAHEITPKAVVQAIDNALELDQNLVQAALTRLSIDKLIGYALSPIARNYLGARSVGRCQSIGLKVIVDREKEIQNFIPEIYFELFLNFSKNNVPFKAKYDSERITEKYKIDKVIEDCKGNDFVISDIKKREKKESPKPPFCTATFQQEAASKLGIGVKESMSVAQKLFEDGKISYHRTDDTTLAPDFITELTNYVKTNYGTVVAPRVGKSDALAQNGHEAIRITDPALTPELFNEQNSNNIHQKVYKLIWQRTIACVLPDAKFSETKYVITNNSHNFIMVSNELIEPGFKQVYNYEKDDEEIIKETFDKDEVLQNCELKMETKSTQPPARFNEATLVQQLKNLGVGRPSTYATIVDTVVSPLRGYATVEDKKIKPTDKGIQLSEFLDRAFPNLINLNYTKEMEESLDKIAAGNLDRLTYLNEFFKNLEDSIKTNSEQLDMPDSTDICPECGAKLVIRRSRFGKLFKGCSNYPNCRHIENIN